MRSNRLTYHPWTVGLAAAGVISLASAVQAEETQHQVMTALASTTLSGYVDTSAIWQFGKGNVLVGRSFDQGSNSAVPGANKQDGFNLNVIKVQLEKPLDEGQWSAGYTVGLLYGPDANVLASASGGTTTSDFAVENANVTVRAPLGNGLDIKMGVFSTVVGYEVLEAGSNPNYSRSFAYSIEPIVHTGVLASYKVNDIISVSGGVADRGDGINTINGRSGIESLKSYLGSITLTAPESLGVLKGANAYVGVIDGGVSSLTPGFGPGHNKDTLNLYTGATVPLPVTGLGVGVAYDYRANALFDSSYENALGGYLTYQATEKLKLAVREEYATGSTGAYGVVATNSKHNVSLLGSTLTVDYSLWANVISRAELRWDHSLTGQGLFDGGVNNLDHNAVSLALNLIYKF